MKNINHFLIAAVLAVVGISFLVYMYNSSSADDEETILTAASNVQQVAKSSYDGPRKLCPVTIPASLLESPNYKDVRGGFPLMKKLDNRNALPQVAVQIGKSKAVEVGVHRGDFAAHVLKTWPGEYTLVDLWEGIDVYKEEDRGSDYAVAMQNVAPYKDRVVVKKGYSHEVSKQFPDEHFDWIYLDATHTYEAAREDLIAWYPKLKKGGLMSGHDYLNGVVAGYMFGVKNAVDEFVMKKGLSVQFSQEPFGSWYFVKCDEEIA